MPAFEDNLKAYYDSRISTLASIKARSLGADIVVLAALNVLAYAQLEGGVKDACACVIRQLNKYKLEFGEVAPRLLAWRNQRDLSRFRTAIDFEMVGTPSPFAEILRKRAHIRAINRNHELNQMTSAALKQVYRGLGLDDAGIKRSAARIDELVGARNEVAHHGSMPRTAANLLERQLRENADIVEGVLADLTKQSLTFFEDRLHRR